MTGVQVSPDKPVGHPPMAPGWQRQPAAPPAPRPEHPWATPAARGALRAAGRRTDDRELHGVSVIRLRDARDLIHKAPAREERDAGPAPEGQVPWLSWGSADAVLQVSLRAGTESRELGRLTTWDVARAALAAARSIRSGAPASPVRAQIHRLAPSDPTSAAEASSAVIDDVTALNAAGLARRLDEGLVARSARGRPYADASDLVVVDASPTGARRVLLETMDAVQVILGSPSRRAVPAAIADDLVIVVADVAEIWVHPGAATHRRDAARLAGEIARELTPPELR